MYYLGDSQRGCERGGSYTNFPNVGTLNAIGHENFENMQFDHPLQLGTEKYIMQ